MRNKVFTSQDLYLKLLTGYIIYNTGKPLFQGDFMLLIDLETQLSQPALTMECAH